MTNTASEIITDPGDAHPRGRCWNCQYDLRAITSRKCPECGGFLEMADVLESPDGVRLMKPTRWIARGAIPIAATALVFDALLLPTPLSLLLLAFLWGLVAGPYIWRSRRRQRKLFCRYPEHLFTDPDRPVRNRIARVFFIIAMIVWSGLWQRAMIYLSLPWLNAYADRLYDRVPADAPLPSSRAWCGLLPVLPTNVDPDGLTLQAGFGTLEYSPPTLHAWSWAGFLPFDQWMLCRYPEPTYTRLSPAWWIQRPPWNFLNPFPQLNR